MNIEITDVVIVAVIVGFVEMAKGIGLPVRSWISGFIRYTGYCDWSCLLPGDIKTSCYVWHCLRSHFMRAI
ncbi:hypothetical protein P7H20_26525 [Paenibacillus larvae]|nr:hypothetical protein [Paenibacillus larvae]MDT2277686.1 hypothetical protein [Paenibacillus larvae]